MTDAGERRPGFGVVPGEGEERSLDPRVASVLEVLAGQRTADVATRWNVDQVLLSRWLRAFVAAGAAEVTNQPLKDAARQRDRFLTAFAHELRTPLATARGWVQMLETDDGDLPPAMVARTVSRLDEALALLHDRVLDVELLAQASLGMLRLQPEPTTIGEVAASLPTQVHGETSLRVSVDLRLFQRVLRDLWDAAQMAPAPRAVRVEAQLVAPWVEIRVVREADPIEPRVLQALFDPFDVNDDATGVTIGLYLARALLVAHGGTLGVDQDDRKAVLWARIPRLD